MNPTTWLASVSGYDTVNDYFNSLNSMYPIGNAPGGDTWGHYLFGWDPSDLSSLQVSAQFFWNTINGYFGWPSATVNAQQTPNLQPEAPQSVVVANQSTSVTGTTSPVTQTGNTTNSVVPLTTGTTAGASLSTAVNSASANDLVIGGFDVTTAMSAVDPILGIPYVVWGGGAVVLFLMMSGGKK